MLTEMYEIDEGVIINSLAIIYSNGSSEEKN